MSTNEPTPLLRTPHDFYLASGALQAVPEFPSNAEHGAVYFTPPTVARNSEAWRNMSIEDKIAQLDHRIALLTGVGKIARSHIEHLTEETMTDQLTGLKNRRAFMLSLEKEVAKSDGGTNPRLDLMFIDLDDFKKLNDTQGHEAGDALLHKIGDKFSEIFKLRGDDEIFRLGGDEFVAIIHYRDVEEDEDGRRNAATQFDAMTGLMKRIQDTVEEAAEAMGASVGASIGMTMHKPNQTAAELLRRADELMYDMKQKSKKPR